MTPSRISFLFIALTLPVAMIGGWAGVSYGLRQSRSPPQLDSVLHSELHLSSAQRDQLATLEAEFAAERTQYESQMRIANRDIASAITVRHQYDNETQSAIDRLHRAMIGLQQATVKHVIAMRAVLSGDQVAQFDRTVNQALAVTPP